VPGYLVPRRPGSDLEASNPSRGRWGNSETASTPFDNQPPQVLRRGHPTGTGNSSQRFTIGSPAAGTRARPAPPAAPSCPPSRRPSSRTAGAGTAQRQRGRWSNTSRGKRNPSPPQRLRAPPPSTSRTEWRNVLRAARRRTVPGTTAARPHQLEQHRAAVGSGVAASRAAAGAPAPARGCAAARARARGRSRRTAAPGSGQPGVSATGTSTAPTPPAPRQHATLPSDRLHPMRQPAGPPQPAVKHWRPHPHANDTAGNVAAVLRQPVQGGSSPPHNSPAPANPTSPRRRRTARTNPDPRPSPQAARAGCAPRPPSAALSLEAATPTRLHHRRRPTHQAAAPPRDPRPASNPASRPTCQPRSHAATSTDAPNPANSATRSSTGSPAESPPGSPPEPHQATRGLGLRRRGFAHVRAALAP
jgi:hypothetical protein